MDNGEGWGINKQLRGGGVECVYIKFIIINYIEDHQDDQNP